MQLTLISRALDNIEGNLTSIMTGREENDNKITNVPSTGGTSTSSVESATKGESSSP
jgi:hypothetical protein